MQINRREFHLVTLGATLPTSACAQTSVQGQKTRTIAPPAPPKPEAQAQAPESGRRIALTLGNNAYAAVPKLANAVPDAKDVAGALAKRGFEVHTLTDFRADGGRRAIQDFTKKLQPGDVALLHYSGHGVQVGGENYLVPVDFPANQGEASVKNGCISVAQIQRDMEKSGVRLNIMIIDACRNNPFNAQNVHGLAMMDAGLGTCLALSAAPGQKASDNPAGRNGLFTQHLLREIEDGGLSIEPLFKRVKDAVYSDTGGHQRPWLLFDVVGDFYFSTDSVPAFPDRSFDGLMAKGQAEFGAGRYPEALALFLRAKKSKPDNPFVCNAVGSTFLRMAKYSSARPEFDHAIELKEDYAAAYFNRGIAFLSNSNYELAVGDFTWAIDTNDQFDPRAYLLRGKANLLLRETQAALADFERVLELNPYEAEALLGRGKIRLDSRAYADAITDLTASIQIKPTAEAYLKRAQAYHATGKFREEQTDQGAAAKLQPPLARP
jgi:hypothetical protein